MPFTSFNFLVFFLVVYVVYRCLSVRGQNRWLLLASYIFYGLWDYRFLVLVLTSTTVDYWVARRIASAENDKKRRGYLLVSLITNLSILGFFKYFNFFIDSAITLVELVGFHPHPLSLNILLPIGISYYTFKTISYTVDVYGGNVRLARNWIEYALFVSFFPQILSGPIDRAATLLPQIEKPRELTAQVARIGIWLFVWGLFKKVVVADNLSEIAEPLFVAGGDISAASAWVAAYAFVFQLYCDFSGYTDMARGVAKLFGFQTSINFRNPYFSVNPIDFWQRWHISLTQWIQDYIYFPMAAQALRKSSSFWSTYKTHIYTMVLIGLWHGASMTYVVFGLLWGSLIVLYYVYLMSWKRMLKYFGIKRMKKKQQPLYAPSRIVSMILMFQIISLSFVLFRSGSVNEALNIYRIMFDLKSITFALSNWDLALINSCLAIVTLYAPVFFVQIHQEVHDDLLSPLSMSPWPRAVLYTVVTVMLLTLAKTGGGMFIYVQF